MRRLWITMMVGALFACQRTLPEETPSAAPPPVLTDGPDTVPPDTSPPGTGGAGRGEVPPTPPACTPATCTSLGQACGEASDGCGGTLQCGTCAPPSSVCVPQSCGQRFGVWACGRTEECGQPLDCGSCSGEDTCGGAGIPNLCAVPPRLPACTSVTAKAGLNPTSGDVRTFRQCLDNGWCSSNNHLGAYVQDLWGFSDNDVWAVGATRQGLALHWDGQVWNRVPLPGPEGLASVWGASPDDVWAVGTRGTVLRWDGKAWRRLALDTEEHLTGVHGTSATDVWVVGPRVALHWDGQRFQETPGWTVSVVEPYLESGNAHVWALGPQDVLAAAGTVCQRWNGRTWTSTDCGIRGAQDIWASGPDDIWVVGFYNSESGFTTTSVRTHWDGQRWTTEKHPDWMAIGTERYFSLWGSGPHDVWLNGTWRFDGQRWSRMCRDIEQHALWGSPTGQLFGFNYRQNLARFEGEQWRQQAVTQFARPSFGRGNMTSLWGQADNRDFFRFDGTAGQGASLGTGPHWVRAFAGTSLEDVWAQSASGVVHWDGQRWSPSTLVSNEVVKGWSVSPTSAFVHTKSVDPRTWDLGLMWQWNGTRWTRMDIDLTHTEVSDLWGSAPDDVWVVGRRSTGRDDSCPTCTTGIGVAWHWDGRTWTRVFERPGHDVLRLFGTSRENVWLLDFRRSPEPRTEALRWDGSTFQFSGALTGEGYGSHIAGTGPDDMWVATVGGEQANTRLYHFNGREWTRETPIPERVHSMTALPGQATFLMTEEGVFYEKRR